MSNSKIGSGKQILNRIIDHLSTRFIPEDELSKSTDMLRTGFLYHCSTSDEAYEAASNLKWGSHYNEDFETTRQGITTERSNVLISEVFEFILDDDDLKERIMSLYPQISSEEYEAITYVIWALITSSEMCSVSLHDECEDIDINARVTAMMKGYKNYLLEKK